MHHCTKSGPAKLQLYCNLQEEIIEPKIPKGRGQMFHAARFLTGPSLHSYQGYAPSRTGNSLSKEDFRLRTRCLTICLTSPEQPAHPCLCSSFMRCEPLPCQPPVEELETRLRLIERNHMSAGMPERTATVSTLDSKKHGNIDRESLQPHEGKVAAGLDLANRPALARLLAIVRVEGQFREVGVHVVFLALPLQRFRPREVAEPVADEVGVALSPESIDDQRGNIHLVGKLTA